MTVFFLDWLELIFRWMHLLVGVAWIGSSLHYVKVDRCLV
ncbi:MAG: urate hydroxylase PuuD, partial [Pseudomonadales bacterium]